ncbi:hypothetical protein ACWOD8_14515 [Enterococcus plantarum]|nr:transposase [Enterococcus plantarum]
MVFSTFRNVQNKIKRPLKLPCSIAPFECLKSLIKVLKRNADGFRNLYDVKLRIALCFGSVLFQPNKNPRGLLL